MKFSIEVTTMLRFTTINVQYIDNKQTLALMLSEKIKLLYLIRIIYPGFYQKPMRLRHLIPPELHKRRDESRSSGDGDIFRLRKQ